MTESDFDKMVRLLDDIEILAKNTPRVDYSHEINNQITNLQTLLTIESHYYVLSLSKGDRNKLSKTIENGEIHQLLFNIQQSFK